MSLSDNKANPMQAYQSALDSGQLQLDPLQYSVVGKLQDLYDRLMAAESAPRKLQKQGGFFSSLFRRPEAPSEEQLVKGLYLWGGVGRGKTLLCDMFYACLLYTSPSPRDQRGSRMPSSA